MLSSPEESSELSLFHRGFDLLYPAIRFTYERVFGQAWFTQITPVLWLGGAPTYRRDFAELRAIGITAVVDVRAERVAEASFFNQNGIVFRQYRVPDTTVPGPEVLSDAVGWIGARVDEGRVVLIHCAKGRGRSATVLAAYLMKSRGMSLDQVEALLRSKRKLVKFQSRHREALETWMDQQSSPEVPSVDPV